MDQRLSLVTLAVADLPRARRFYEDALGWTPLNALEEVCFYQLPGLVLSLFKRADLEADCQRAIDGTFSGIALALNERSRAEVDATFAQVLVAGAAPLKPPTETSWGGYAGYFADLDGHVWELAHNPGAAIHLDGSTTF